MLQSLQIRHFTLIEQRLLDRCQLADYYTADRVSLTVPSWRSRPRVRSLIVNQLILFTCSHFQF